MKSFANTNSSIVFREKGYLIIDVFIVFSKVLRARENSTRIYRYAISYKLVCKYAKYFFHQNQA